VGCISTGVQRLAWCGEKRIRRLLTSQDRNNDNETVMASDTVSF
jgi:hypothetical protein